MLEDKLPPWECYHGQVIDLSNWRIKSPLQEVFLNVVMSNWLQFSVSLAFCELLKIIYLFNQRLLLNKGSHSDTVKCKDSTHLKNLFLYFKLVLKSYS